MSNLIQRDGEFIGVPINLKLLELAQAMFLQMPQLSFVAVRKTTQDHIIRANVYQNGNYLGYIGWDYRPTNLGGQFKYAVMSHRIRNQRGDKNVKYTTKIDSAVRIAKEYFAARDGGDVVKVAVESFDNKFRSLMWPLQSKYQDFATKYAFVTLGYVYRVSQGETPTIDQSLLQELNSESFRKMREDRNISRRVQKNFERRNGVLVRILRDETISVLDIGANKIAMEIKSTYDLPKNFQEKLAILKVMGRDTPIDNVGVAFELCIDPGTSEVVYFLINGNTIVE
jgi:hypothetical protein